MLTPPLEVIRKTENVGNSQQDKVFSTNKCKEKKMEKQLQI
jgi:hypothetical protein